MKKNLLQKLIEDEEERHYGERSKDPGISLFINIGGYTNLVVGEKGDFKGGCQFYLVQVYKLI